MGRRSIETLVGVFVLLGILGLLFLAVKAAHLGSFGGSEIYTLTAYFDNIGGLKVRAPVRSAGVTVGRVAAISLDPKHYYQAAVRLEVDKQFQFPSDSSARILTSGLLGDQYIGVSPGVQDKMFAGGDEIKQTQSAIVLETLISQFLFSKAADAGGSTAPAAAAGGGKK